MRRPTIISIAAGVTLLATGSLAQSCNLTNVPLSPDPNHSTFTFVLDQSVEGFINATNTATIDINTVEVSQLCYKTINFGYAHITGFGPQQAYTITTDRCQKGDSTWPVAYVVRVCVGDGSSCELISDTAPKVVCGPQDDDVLGRSTCPVLYNGGNPKAISLNDTVPWVCRICPDRHCNWWSNN
ncbi:hypothetical protein LY78DRAFT_587368 [Colletotrichum sublineola]|nr:hypothetical protein LY78DRAFT_587368 [Colletotrichum sublineola]